MWGGPAAPATSGLGTVVVPGTLSAGYVEQHE